MSSIRGIARPPRMLNVWSMRVGNRVSVAIKTMARTTA